MIGASGARADDASAAFRVPDPEHELAGVRLCPDVPIAGDTLDFRRGGDGWELAIARPPVSRMEYLVELRYLDGPVTLHEVPDMHNYTAWRDAFDRHLTRLLRRMCP